MQRSRIFRIGKLCEWEPIHHHFSCWGQLHAQRGASSNSNALVEPKYKLDYNLLYWCYLCRHCFRGFSDCFHRQPHCTVLWHSLLMVLQLLVGLGWNQHRSLHVASPSVFSCTASCAPTRLLFDALHCSTTLSGTRCIVSLVSSRHTPDSDRRVVRSSWKGVTWLEEEGKAASSLPWRGFMKTLSTFSDTTAT